MLRTFFFFLRLSKIKTIFWGFSLAQLNNIWCINSLIKHSHLNFGIVYLSQGYPFSLWNCSFGSEIPSVSLTWISISNRALFYMLKDIFGTYLLQNTLVTSWKCIVAGWYQKFFPFSMLPWSNTVFHMVLSFFFFFFCK